MKYLLSLILLFTCLDSFAAEKVKICHVPSGNPANAHTIEISQNALRAHLGLDGNLHGGDYLGACRHEGFQGFYACNISMKQNFETNNGTLTTHDYVTYSYSNPSGESESELVLEAGKNTYKSIWTEKEAFSQKLTSASFNLSSEVYGTDYSIDFCFDGRRFSNSEEGLVIDEIRTFSERANAVDISYQVFCDVHYRGNGIPNLSRIDLSRGLPLRFQEVPEFCVVRFKVIEEDEGRTRDWTRTFNKLTAIIESNLDEISND